MVMVGDMRVFLCMFSTCLTTLSSCVLMVDDAVDGRDIWMEETMEVGDTMMYPFTEKFFNESWAEKTKSHDIIQL